MAIKRLAVLTSGGDAPGMNAAIRAVTRKASAAGVETIGVRNGYRGLMTGNFLRLDDRAVGGILSRGGTMLGSARAPEFIEPAGQAQALDALRERQIDGLIVIGGNGSQSGALALHNAGFPTVGVASTIDNDLNGFDTTIGVDTALNTALEMIDRLRDTASSHHRAFVVEVMGRNSGYLALMTGLASGAEIILTPEIPYPIERVPDVLHAAYARGKTHFIVVAAEGSPVKAAEVVERLNKEKGRYEARLSVLGHVQRGGSPLVFDRLLATRSAAAAVDALISGQSGVVAGLARGRISLVPTAEAIQPCTKVPREMIELAETLAR
ncbi:MAG TPA: ATP-dependent 6-phosphofructokinase [Thermomicrobiales bacterium]